MNLRIGVINIMPKAEGYEKPLLETLGMTGFKVQPLWIRLSTHAYRSSDPLHLKRHYCVFSEAQRHGPLHGLILSGAPVEKIPYEEVNYWPELSPRSSTWLEGRSPRSSDSAGEALPWPSA